MLVMRNCHLPRASALPIIDRTPTRPAGSSRSQSTLISAVQRRRRDFRNWPDSCVAGRKHQFAKYFTQASVLYSKQHIPNDAPQLQTCGNGLRTRPGEGTKPGTLCRVEDCSASYLLAWAVRPSAHPVKACARSDCSHPRWFASCEGGPGELQKHSGCHQLRAGRNADLAQSPGTFTDVVDSSLAYPGATGTPTGWQR
jgi:hypothetical protein